jgi:hypothetical protein
MKHRYGSDRNGVYALMTCGNASSLGLRWEEGNGFLERARQRISATGTGGEWIRFVDAFQALCMAGMGECQRSLDLARRAEERATNDTTGGVKFGPVRLLAGYRTTPPISTHRSSR